MAVKNKYLEEAARAAVLVTHSAAGLAAASSSREAARLLRAAEALARSAVAVLAASSTRSCSSGTPDPCVNGTRDVPPGSAGDGMPSTTTRRARHRGRRSKQKPMEEDVQTKQDKDVDMVKPPRVLVRHETAPSPPPSTPTSSAPSVVPPSGTLGLLHGLAARPELNGVAVRFLRHDVATDRFIVELKGGSTVPIRVQRKNFVANNKDEKAQKHLGRQPGGGGHNTLGSDSDGLPQKVTPRLGRARR